MPHIVNRRLEILYDLAKQQAECIVTCTLIFTKQESQQQVSNKLQYEMKCQLFNITFDGVIPISQLTKDASKDELYSLLTLTNPTIEPRKLKKQTNLVEIIWNSELLSSY